MRTKVVREPIKIELYTMANYQRDDGLPGGSVHTYEWHGVSASGKTKREAMQKLSQRVEDRARGFA